LNYNEKIFDLQDSKKEVKQFTAVSSKEVNAENVKTLLEQGKKSRATKNQKEWKQQ
jgi:non-homologous end joining protein Ku